MNTPKTLQEEFKPVQHKLNPLNIKAQLISEGVSRDVLDRIIPLYEKAVVPIIYPLIVEDND